MKTNETEVEPNKDTKGYINNTLFLKNPLPYPNKSTLKIRKPERYRSLMQLIPSRTLITRFPQSENPQHAEFINVMQNSTYGSFLHLNIIGHSGTLLNSAEDHCNKRRRRQVI